MKSKIPVKTVLETTMCTITIFQLDKFSMKTGIYECVLSLQTPYF